MMNAVCAECGKSIHRKPSQLAKGGHFFCSRACLGTFNGRTRDKKGGPLTCQCGAVFYAYRFEFGRRLTCSSECSHKASTKEGGPNWNGGEFLNTARGVWMVYHPRAGKTGKHVPRYRVVVAAFLGRELSSDEYVLHINGSKLDDSPENLYVCESGSERAKRRTGALPWPTVSNLDHLKQNTNVLDSL